MSRSSLGWGLLVLSPSLALGAAPPAPGAAAPAASPAPLAEQVSVRVVELAVTATDAAGAPVGDLRRDDFRVLEDGRPVEIDDLVPPAESHAGTAAEKSAERAAATSHLVVFLDEAHTTPARRSGVYDALGKALKAIVARTTQVMIVRYDGSIEVLQPFRPAGHETATLGDAARYLSARSISGESDRMQVLDGIRADALVHDNAADMPGGPCLFGDQLARNFMAERRDDARELLRSVDGLIGALDSIPGRKAFLYVGDLVPRLPGGDALELYLELCGGEGVARGKAIDVATMGSVRNHRPDPQKVRMELVSEDMSEEWAGLAARATGLGVTVSSLAVGEPRGSGNVKDVAPTSGALQAATAMAVGDVANQLADVTGGVSMASGAALDAPLAHTLERRPGTYLLSWTVPDPDDPRQRRVSVEVTRPGVRLDYRDRYAPLGREEAIGDRLAAALVLGVVDNPLEAAVTIEAASKTPARPARLRVSLPLDRLTLLPEGSGARGLFTVYLLARDASLRLGAVHQRTVPVKVQAGRLEAAQQKDFVYEVSLPAAGATKAIAIAVRDELSGDVSVLRADVHGG